MLDENKPMNRRRFFREGLREFLRPLINAVEPLERVARHVGSLEEQLSAGSGHYPPTPDVWLRPPGALPEHSFQSTCSRCGECVRVCPAQAIKLDMGGYKGNGAPYIEADLQACVLCDGLLCMSHCPSGALQPTAIEHIHMGLAIWNEHICVRARGDECTICVDHCPVGKTAIELIDGRITVKDPGCTGCGVCQRDCPTSPKSIVVMPSSAHSVQTPM